MIINLANSDIFLVVHFRGNIGLTSKINDTITSSKRNINQMSVLPPYSILVTNINNTLIALKNQQKCNAAECVIDSSLLFVKYDKYFYRDCTLNSSAREA